MKIFSLSMAVFFGFLALATLGHAAIITFDTAHFGTTLNYDESGYGFHVVSEPPYDYMLLNDGTRNPRSGTPYMSWDKTYSHPEYIVIAPADGGKFGLVSADLADKTAPTSRAVEIIFNGFRSDNSMVTATFSRPSSPDVYFQPFTFGSDFASGLVRVEIHSDRFAMDNLVIVPEPGTTSLMVVGIMVFAGLAKRKRHKCTKATVT